MANWAQLPHDLLVLIVELLKNLKDFFAFRRVCKSWCAVAKKEFFKALWLQKSPPYLMLPIRGPNKRELYSLSEGEIVASIRVRNLSKRKCYESLGWFLAVEKDGSMCLLDPFSKVEIPLPHQCTLPNFRLFHPYHVVRKMVLSARPKENSNFIVALIFRCLPDIAFWRPGDKSWHRIRKPGGFYEDLTYHAGHFYTFDDLCEVKSFNVSEVYPPRVGQFITRRVPGQLSNLMRVVSGNENVYVIKTFDSLLLVARSFLRRFGESVTKTIEFRVYKYDTPLNKWKKIDNLGNMAIFVGCENATTIVDASTFHGSVKANHVYFTDDGPRSPYGRDGHPDKLTGQDMGIYSLENGTIEPFYHRREVFRSRTSHPTWIIPSSWPLNC